jgi:tRNA(fMet)-specific endonuclease VapC
MSSRALLDTDIFSEILRGRNEMVLERERAHFEEFGPYALSTITVLEVVKGLHKAGREDRIQALVSRFDTTDIFALDRRGAELAGRIHADLERTGQPLGFADPIIAAIAMTHDVTLVSGNVSHYERIRALGYGLPLDNWRDPAPTTESNA